MAITGLALAATRKVPSKYDTALHDKDKTIFEIGTLDSRIIGMIRDKATSLTVNQNAASDMVESNVNMNAVYFEACVYGIRDITNFKDKIGDDIKFETVIRNHAGIPYETVHPSVMRQIPNDIIVEMGQLIMASNQLTAAEGKN